MRSIPKSRAVKAWLGLYPALAVLCLSLHAHALEADFVSHLPLVVIDKSDSSRIDGVAGNQQVKLRLVDNASKVNLPSDSPTFEAAIVLQTVGQDGRLNELEDKASYRIEFADGSEHSFAGLPAGVEFSLLGTARDKAMLRTWLGCTLAAVMMPGGAPETRYCELFIQENDAYRYQGLYLLSEKLVDGVWLSENGIHGKTAIARFTSNGDSDVAPLPMESVFSPWGNGLRVLHSQAKDDKTVPAVFSEIGGQLVSSRPDVFFIGMDHLELDSFVNAYLLNEVLLNRAADPFYFYLNTSGRVGISPRFDFNDTFDNALEPPALDAQANTEKLPWFSRLLQSTPFIDALEKRYYALIREKVLGADNLNTLLDGVEEYLGSAYERDWQRWQKLYVEDARYVPQPNPEGPDGEVLVRLTTSFPQELRKIRRQIREDDFGMRDALMRMHWRDGLWTQARDSRRNLINATVFIAGFFLVVAYSRNRM